MKPPVWLIMSLCTTNAASTYNFIFPDLSIDKISGRKMVPCMYFITLARFVYSSLSGPLTLVHRKDADIWMSGRALFEIYSSCATKWWKRSASAWDSFVASSAMSKRWCAAGLLEYCQAFFQCSRSSRILPYQASSNQWSYWGIYVLCPALWSFLNLPIFRINFRKNAGNNGRVDM